MPDCLTPPPSSGKALQVDDEGNQPHAWQPLGLIVHRFVGRCQIPVETAIAALEANRINVETDHGR